MVRRRTIAGASRPPCETRTDHFSNLLSCEQPLVPQLKPECYRTAEVFLQTGLVVGLVNVRPLAALTQQTPISFLDPKSYLETERVAAGSQGERSVGLTAWFKPACTDATPQIFASRRALVKTGAARVAGIANSSSEGRPSSLVSRALRILPGPRPETCYPQHHWRTPT